MPLRSTPLANQEYYHIYNRGVAHLPTYLNKRDYERFLLGVSYYRFGNIPFKLSRLLQLPQEEREKKLNELQTKNYKSVNLISYVLMPNHFHILLQQNTEDGISKFMKHLTDSYTRFFNTKHDRVGPLYQGAFKAVRIETDEQLIHVSRYIHLNPLVSFIVNQENFLTYPWSSLQLFLKHDLNLVNTQPILHHFSSPDNYLQFILDQADYGKKLEEIKHLVLEK